MNVNIGKHYKAKIYGCVPFDNEQNGFALPIFTSANCPEYLLVQEVDEVSGVVSGFAQFDSESAMILRIYDEIYAHINGLLIFSSIDEGSSIHSGNLAEIEPILNNYRQRRPQSLGINLQIAELVGTPEQKQFARSGMRKLIEERTGEIAAYSFYEKSALRIALWDLLIMYANGDEAAHRILSLRSQITIDINDEGGMLIDQQSLIPDNLLKIAKTRISQILEIEFCKVRPSPRLDSVDERIDENFEEKSSVLDKSCDDKARELLYIVSLLSRQEERLALILKVLFNDCDLGKKVIELYDNELAKYTRIALRELRLIVNHKLVEFGSDILILSMNTPFEELKSISSVLDMVFRVFSGSMPKSRAFLLYFLCKHLANYPEANYFLMKKVEKSKSIFFKPFQEESFIFLTEGIQGHSSNLEVHADQNQLIFNFFNQT
jgi:hypothetical protein